MSNQDIIKSAGEIRQLPVKFDAESLISKAIEHNLPVETMERLLAMRSQLKAEAAREAYFTALAGFQSECPVIRKTKLVRDKRGNPRYRYAPLDEIVKQAGPILKEYGFSYTIQTRHDKDLNAIISTCTLHHNEGHSETSEFTAPIDAEAFMNEPQKYGSASSFSKRYAFCNATGILTSDEDDDAGGASNEPKPETISQEQIFALHSRLTDAGIENADDILRRLAANLGINGIDALRADLYHIALEKVNNYIKKKQVNP